MLNLSGASTKIAGLAGVSDYIYNVLGYRPTDITGISAGSLLSIPIAMRKWDVIREMTQTFNLDDVFDKKPINKKNKISCNAILRAITSKSSLGTQNNLYKTLAKIITKEDFTRFQDGDYPNVWIGSIDFITGGRYIVNLKDKQYSYEDYLKLVNASASIPLAVEAVYYKDMILYDGGVRNHILSSWALNNIKGITESISVFSRPEDYSSILDRNWKDNNLMSVFERYTDINIIEISKRDEKEEILKLMLMENVDGIKIKNKQIFIPSIIKEMYDADPAKLRKLYAVGLKVAALALSDW